MLGTNCIFHPIANLFQFFNFNIWAWSIIFHLLDNWQMLCFEKLNICSRGRHIWSQIWIYCNSKTLDAFYINWGRFQNKQTYRMLDVCRPRKTNKLHCIAAWAQHGLLCGGWGAKTCLSLSADSLIVWQKEKKNLCVYFTNLVVKSSSCQFC